MRSGGIAGVLPDELALAGPEHLDPAYVEGYDRKARIDAARDLDVLREHGPTSETTLVDLGAGTGTFALAAAAHCRRVVAVDVSPAMLDAMETKVSGRGLTNVECVRAGFLTYEHSGEPADVVHTRNALHHLPDFWKAIALQRIAELLKPGGLLHLRDLVFAFDPADAERCVAAWLETGAARTEDGWTCDELAAHLRDEHSTFSWLLEPMLERAGFEVLRAEYGSVKVYAEYLCRSRVR